MIDQFSTQERTAAYKEATLGEERSWDTTLLSSNSIYVGALELSTDTAQKYWVRRNVSMILSKE